MLLRTPASRQVPRDALSPGLERLKQLCAYQCRILGATIHTSAAQRSGHRAQCATAQQPQYVADTADASAIRCTIRDVPGTAADFLADTLIDLGAQSTSVTEHRPPGAEEQEIFDLQQSTREVWDRCTVTAHFSPDHDVQSTLQLLRSAVELDGLTPELSAVSDSEWIEGICAAYQPTHIVGSLWIIPTSSQPPDPTALNIVVEPGLAFGTGEHPTTRLCLRAVHALADFQGKHVLDYGTGSGVLALAALKMGASLAVGVDTDAVAVKAAAQNGALNSFQGEWITLRCGPSLDDPEPLQAHASSLPKQYDVCLANILRGPLLELQPRLSAYVKPGGVLILSGIVEAQVADIKAAYGGTFCDFEVQTDENWAQVLAIRRSESV